MAMFIRCLTLVLFLVTSSQALEDEDEGFLEGSSCHDAQDCYINGGSQLALACYYNVNKCKCYSTISSIYHLSWNSTSKECLSSKYGHCGANGPVKVGCSDGFACIDNRCRDPNDKMKTTKSVVTFPVTNCEACRFAPQLSLTCDSWNGPSTSCQCKQIYVADGRSNAWDIRNYEGRNNCSVSQFGPCGSRNGVTIGCHGKDISCVQGICTNPDRPLSAENELCQETKNCLSDLICSHGYTCIKPKSSPEGTSCYTAEECRPGLICRHPQSPWGYARCAAAGSTASA